MPALPLGTTGDGYLQLVGNVLLRRTYKLPVVMQYDSSNLHFTLQAP